MDVREVVEYLDYRPVNLKLIKTMCQINGLAFVVDP